MGKINIFFDKILPSLVPFSMTVSLLLLVITNDIKYLTYCSASGLIGLALYIVKTFLDKFKK